MTIAELVTRLVALGKAAQGDGRAILTIRAGEKWIHADGSTDLEHLGNADLWVSSDGINDVISAPTDGHTAMPVDDPAAFIERLLLDAEKQVQSKGGRE